VTCQVIAPALTPRRPGQRIKTDRRDAVKLVRLFRAGELTAIHVPDEVEEAVRDLTRCREDVRRDVLRWRHRLLKFLDRHGRLYVTGKNWSQRHWTWIRAQRFDLAPLQRTFDATLFALRAGARPPGRTGHGDRGARRTDALSRAGRLAALLPGDRHPVGHDPARRDRRLSAVPPPPGADGVPGFGPERVLLRRNPAPRMPSPKPATPTHGACSSRPRGTIATAPRWAGRWPPAPRTSHGVPHAGLAGAAASASSLPPSRRARQTSARRGDRHRPRTGRLHLGRHDAAGGGVDRFTTARGPWASWAASRRARWGHDWRALAEPMRRLVLGLGRLARLDGGRSRRTTVMRLCPGQPAYISLIRRRSRLIGTAVGALRNHSTPDGNQTREEHA
jgi:hypothetical protein